MTTQITDRGGYVELKYEADNGGTAVTAITGLTASEVKERASEFATAHNLQTKAQEDGT